jgi:hypothetical protein
MRMNLTKAALAALALGLAAPVAAQDHGCLAKAQAAAERVSDGALRATACLRESLRERSPVSGAATRLRGLMDSAAFEQGHQRDTHAFEIYVAVPGALCMRYLGRDGRYHGAQDFAVRSAGWVRVPFDTTYDQQLAGLGRQGLSVQAKTGADCSKDGGLRLAPVRVGSSGGAFTLIAQIDPGSDARLLVYPRDQAKRPDDVGCEPITATDSAVSYNIACPVPSAALQDDALTNLNIRGGAKVFDEAVPLVSLPR